MGEEDSKNMANELAETMEAMKNELLGLKEVVSEIKVPKKEEEETKGETKKVDGSMSPDDLVTKIMGALEAKTSGANAQVFDTMYKQEVDKLVGQFGAFRDHLESTDDYGEVIGDKIKGISDFEKRNETLKRVFDSFVDASTSSSDGSDIRVSKSVQKKLDDDNAQIDSLKSKFDSGEVSEEKFRDEFFGALENQLNTLRG